MKHKILYRGLRKRDYEALADIVVSTWGFDEFVSSKSEKRHLGLSYIYDCLIYNDYSCIAEVDGNTAGIIIGADYGRKCINMKFLIMKIYHSVMLRISSGFKTSEKNILNAYGKVMQEMDKSCPQKGNAEIRLFIVDSRYRGMGLGSRIFRHLNSWFSKNHIASYYVHTDNVCNYRFYEKHGMKLICERKTDISYAGVENVDMFLYSKEKTI